MTVKTRLAKLEATHVARVKREDIRSTSTPATRAQATAELEMWRREQFAKGILSDNEGHIYEGDAVETWISELNANDRRQWARIDSMAVNRAELSTASS